MRNIFINKKFENMYKENPIVLIDIGASGGIDPKWRKANKYLTVIGFEPDKKAYNDLLRNNTNMERNIYMNIAIDKEENERYCLYLTRKQSCTSFYKPNKSLIAQFNNPERFDIVDKYYCKAKKLSINLLNNVGINDADFLKIDTQGSELQIMKGAIELIDNYLFGIEVEVEFAQIYLDQPCFSDVDYFLRNKGYQLFGLKRSFWRRKIGINAKMARGQLISADALYFKTYENYVNYHENFSKNQIRKKIFKALSILVIHRVIDYALYICDRAYGDKIIDRNEKGIIERAIYRKRGWKRIRTMRRLSRLIYHLHLALKNEDKYSNYADEDYWSTPI